MSTILGDTTITCPRCFHAIPADVRFCPHCGMPDVATVASDTAPVDVTVRDRTIRILDRIAVGSICTLYRCRFAEAGAEVEGIFKIARDPRTNDLVANEAAVLQQLHVAPGHERFSAFLPAVVESFGVGDGAAG